MKSYHVLECANQKQIANELHLFLLKENRVLEKDNLKFWNFLNKKELFNSTEPMQSFSISDDELPTKGLKDH